MVSNTVSIGVSKRPSVNGRVFTVGDCGFSSESQRDHSVSCDLEGDLSGDLFWFAIELSSLIFPSFIDTSLVSLNCNTICDGTRVSSPLTTIWTRHPEERGDEGPTLSSLRQDRLRSG